MIPVDGLIFYILLPFAAFGMIMMVVLIASFIIDKKEKRAEKKNEEATHNNLVETLNERAKMAKNKLEMLEEYLGIEFRSGSQTQRNFYAKKKRGKK